MADQTATLTDPRPWPAADQPDGRHAIRISNLQHYFGQGALRNQVLFDNNLEIAPGEIVIMTGPSGGGKTTLLTLIGTLRTVQEGSVEVLGHKLEGATPQQLIAVRRKIGFVFQHHNLFASLTAFQNARMALELFQYDKAEMKSRITETLTRLGLGHRIYYRPGALSGGQKQRVAIARGLVHDPQLILADEPTAALDEKSGRDVVTLFQELARRHRATILMVTHDNRILDVADRIITMVQGRIKSNVVVRESSLVCEFLVQCPIFTRLTPRTLTEVADQVVPEKHPGGAVIVRQGDPGDKFYVIKSGTVDAIEEAGATRRTVADLGTGNFFGDAALLTGAPLRATVVAKEDLEVYTLGKEQFQAVLQASASFEEEVRKSLFERQ